MNELQDTMFRLAAIADELEQAGFREDAEQITQLMESVTADVLRGHIRQAQFEAGAFAPSPYLNRTPGPFDRLMQGTNPATAPAQPAAAAPVSATPEATAAAGRMGMTNEQQVLAARYLTWAKEKGGTAGLLNRIYGHASQYQSPQFVNKLMDYLKSQGVQ
jgi:hypothetical protein